MKRTPQEFADFFGLYVALDCIGACEIFEDDRALCDGGHGSWCGSRKLLTIPPDFIDYDGDWKNSLTAPSGLRLYGQRVFEEIPKKEDVVVDRIEAGKWVTHKVTGSVYKIKEVTNRGTLVLHGVYPWAELNPAAYRLSTEKEIEDHET